ncbi:MAG: flotillin domain-containing protein [Pseudomonadota bacterium]
MAQFTSYLDILLVAGTILVAVILLVLVIARLYTRASKEISFVRTGAGGQKVIMNGGALVLPVFHEVIPVNMNTLRLDVHRNDDQALITKDRMRVDVAAEFYVRVQPTADAIANAAQTLGQRTMQPTALKQLVEGKFVDALRSVAAEMAMEELHEQRTDFVQKVQQVVSEDLLKNGLELETVSLTGLDQTGKEFFNPDNAFDAEGLTKLTEAIEARRKKRNDIEQETQVLIQRKNLEAAQQQLEIDREEEYAKLAQEREVEVRRASQQAEIALERAAKRQEAERADIVAQQQVEQSRIESERAVEQQRIAKEQEIRERDLSREKAVQTADIERQRAIELSEQDREIAVAEKSRDQSLAEKLADEARAEAVRAAEQVTTVREVEVAERLKSIELVEATKEAERDKIDVTVKAQAVSEAADDEAAAVRTRAEAEADRIRIEATAAAESERLRAEGAAERYRVDAEGKRAINESANVLSPEQIAMQVKLSIVEQLPEIIRQSVKPMEQIDGIKIVQVAGLNGAGEHGGGDGETAANGAAPANGTRAGLADQVVNSALRYRAQAPLIESILGEVGLSGESLDGLAQVRDLTPNGKAPKASPSS